MGRDALRLCRVETRRAGQCRRAAAMVQETPRRLQMPPLRGVRRDPEDEHGQDPEIQAARDGEGGVNLQTPCLGAVLEFARSRNRAAWSAACRFVDRTGRGNRSMSTALTLQPSSGPTNGYH